MGGAASEVTIRVNPKIAIVSRNSHPDPPLSQEKVFSSKRCRIKIRRGPSDIRRQKKVAFIRHKGLREERRGSKEEEGGKNLCLPAGQKMRKLTPSTGEKAKIKGGPKASRGVTPHSPSKENDY